MRRLGRHPRPARHSPAAEPSTLYAVRSERVEAARRGLDMVLAAPHEPRQARAAATTLGVALGEAVSFATGALASGQADPAGRAAWRAELVRLAGISERLRRSVLDEPGVLVPTVVRVGSRAASGPHIPGMVAEPASLVAATLHEPRIGVALPEATDAAVSAASPGRRAERATVAAA